MNTPNPSFFYYMFLPFRRYGDFKGRSRRLELWAFSVFNIPLIAIANASIAVSFETVSEDNAFTLLIIWATAGVAHAFISIGLCVRRLHDCGISGLWLLLTPFIFIPYIGIMAALVLLYFLYIIEFKKGEKGPNRFGPSPIKDETSNSKEGRIQSIKSEVEVLLILIAMCIAYFVLVS